MSIEINAKKKIGDEVKTASIVYDFGKDLAEMVKKFGEDVTFTNARGSMKITAQSAMRRYIENGKTQEEITTLMAAWKPGVAIERTVDPVAMLQSKWGSMTEEEKADVLKRLKQMK